MMPIYKFDCILCGVRGRVNPYATRFAGLENTEYRVFGCDNCRLKWLCPMPTHEEYSQMYTEQYFQSESIPIDYDEESETRIKKFRRTIRRIYQLKQTKNIKVLDVGAATGDFVNEARRFGFVAYGVELSDYGCGYATEEYGIQLIKGDFLEVDFGSKEFDVVHLCHTFEHFLEPLEVLAKITQLLTPDGLLIIEVPNQFNSVFDFARERTGIRQSQRFSLFSLHHPFFYSPDAIRKMLNMRGFGIDRLLTWKWFYPVRAANLAQWIVKIGLLGIGNLFDRGNIIEVYARNTTCLA